MTLLQNPHPSLHTLESGLLILVDKPLGWTSFDVVNKIRYRLKKISGNKKMKVGHAGTLDPLATGLLLVCCGPYTKQIDNLQVEHKTYTGTITFGATTVSMDREKPVSTTFPTAHLNDELLTQLLPQFCGDIQQIPPSFSAIKINGKRLYKNARSGEIVQVEPRQVKVASFCLSPLRPAHCDLPGVHVVASVGTDIHQYPDYPPGLHADFVITCGKGTYIRSLAADLGEKANSGAFLSKLCRTACGNYHLSSAWELPALLSYLDRQIP